MNNRLEKWKELYLDARSKRSEIDAKILRRRELYHGTSRVKDKVGGYATRAAHSYRNMCFELIETQINNGVPAPKVTPRDKRNMEKAVVVENYLKSEMDRLSAESLNDETERETYTQGCVQYFIGWDESQTTPTTRGELVIKDYPLDRFYMQPGANSIKTAEYVFTLDLVSVRKIKQLYGIVVDESSMYRGMNVLVTVWFINDEGYLGRFGWIDSTDYVVFDDYNYELRRILICSKCGQPILEETKCPKCYSKTFKWINQTEEVLEEDVLVDQGMDEAGQPRKPLVLAAKGEIIPFYKIRELPFVIRVNISSSQTPLGVSDIDILEKNQESLNKIVTKMEENILKGGSIVTVPKGTNINNTDESLKIIQIKDPNVAKMFNVYSIQANSQQDDVLAERMYGYGRNMLGITDSFQGKRDPTAESGKAKEISAAQAAGRLESKRRMKDAAYAEIYRLMFKFLLAYCDENRSFTKVDPVGDVVEESFSRYSFLDGVPGAVNYNDRYLFSVDTASVLNTSREAMWRETTNNFSAGTFGNPADPQALLLYWSVMKDLGYPLAKQSLSNLQKRTEMLPFEIQQAILQNPEILKAVQQLIAEGGESSENSKP